jgi:hypothetical protein
MSTSSPNSSWTEIIKERIAERNRNELQNPVEEILKEYHLLWKDFAQLENQRIRFKHVFHVLERDISHEISKGNLQGAVEKTKSAISILNNLLYPTGDRESQPLFKLSEKVIEQQQLLLDCQNEIRTWKLESQKAMKRVIELEEENNKLRETQQQQQINTAQISNQKELK